MRYAVAEAVVTRVERDAVWVRLRSTPSCGPCADGRGCGADRSLLSLSAGDKDGFSLPWRGPREVTAGEFIQISMPIEGLVVAVLGLFGLPLLGFFGGASSAEFFPSHGWADNVRQAAGAAIGLALGAFVSRRLLNGRIGQWLIPKVSYEP